MNPPAENASEVFWTAPPQSTHSTELTDKLLQRWAEQIEAGVDVRGNHVDKEGKPLFINRLFLERSPYLQQHAHNPVDWRPWGEEALKEAQSQKKLIFLSVGYSTCHWCHVMEEESFEDLEIAAELNANYISIKVDREERPDLDALYMRAVQLMRGRGGWPMSLWLTPDGKPFLAATYIPARDGERGRAKGFLTLLKEVQTEYLIDPNAFFEDAEKLQEGVRRSLVPQPPQNIDVDSVLRRGEEQALQSYDAVFGGRSGSPKFPSSFPLPFLLQRAQKQPEKWREMISKTLLNMAKGGVYDHVGGGFHRYSVDARWQIPHFEKMLYDNALLAMVYLKAHRLYPQENWAAITKDILDYILRDMTSPEGGFYAATDADALGPSGEIEEGYFFSWTPDELEAVLPNHGQEVAKFFSVTARGNFEGRTVLQAQYPTAWWVEKSSINADHRETLRVARATRPPPLRDEKILVAWNGLMISAFSHAGFYLNQEKYRDASIRAGDFLWNKLRIDGVLHRSFAQGEAYNRGFSEDYALLIAAYLDIFAHTGEDRFWTRALELDSVLELEYEDPDGGWYRTSNKADPLLVREMPMRDGAEPSAASVAIQNILRFGEYTSDTRYKARFERAIARYGGRLTQAPLALDHMLLSLDWVVDSPKEVVLVAKDEKDAEGFLQVLRDHVPISMVLVQNYMNPESSLVPIAQNKGLRGGKATVYVCEGGVCQSPIIDPQNLPALLSIQQK